MDQAGAVPDGGSGAVEGLDRELRVGDVLRRDPSPRPAHDVLAAYGGQGTVHLWSFGRRPRRRVNREVAMPTRLRLIFTVLNATLLFMCAVPIYSNWDRISAAHVSGLLVSAAGCGMTLTVLIIVATGRLAYRGETGPSA